MLFGEPLKTNKGEIPSSRTKEGKKSGQRILMWFINLVLMCGSGLKGGVERVSVALAGV